MHCCDALIFTTAHCGRPSPVPCSQYGAALAGCQTWAMFFPGKRAKRPVWGILCRDGCQSPSWTRKTGRARGESTGLSGGECCGGCLRCERGRAPALAAGEGQGGLLFGRSGQNGGQPAAFGLHHSILIFRGLPVGGRPSCCARIEVRLALRQFRGDDPDFPRICEKCGGTIVAVAGGRLVLAARLVLLGFVATVPTKLPVLFPDRVRERCMHRHNSARIRAG